MPTKDEMMLAARLVQAGVIDREQAQAVLRERDGVREQIAAPSLLDLLVKREWITRTELSVFRDRPLEEIQPFPKYVIHGKLAEGGMSMVYRATYKPLGVQVALKVMKPELSRQPRFLLRFRREAGLLLKLEHEGIVRGYDLAEQERVWYCAMEFAEGESLLARVEREGRLPEEVALRLCLRVLRAVAYLDGRGIVHRDLKPDNLVVAPGGGVKIIDLGLCLLRHGMREDGSGGTTVGTVEYLSPEQARGDGDLDVRADLYSLGATIHHLVAGRVPFRGESPEETLAMQVLKPFGPRHLVAAGASERLVELVTRLLAKDRDGRPPSADALLQEIEAGWPAVLPPEPAPVPLPAAAPPAPSPVEAPPPAGPKLVSRKERSRRGDGPGRRR